MAIPVCSIVSQELGPDAVPQNLWAAQIDQYTLRLAWNAVPGASAYRISCASRGMPERVLGTMATGQLATYANGVPRRVSYAMPIPPRDLGADYRCSVEWRTAKGQFYGKTAFNPVTTVSGNMIRRDPPAYATATSTSEDSITLTWAPVIGATAYTINREVAPFGFSVFCDLCSTASTSIVDRFAERSRKHRYFVTPITPAGAGQRATSNYIVPGVPPDTTPITPGTPISPPASVTARIAGPASAKVSWFAIRGPAAYEMTRNLGSSKFPRVVRVPNDLTGVLIEVPDNLALETRNGATPVTVSYSVRSIDPSGKAVTGAVTSNTITVSLKDAAALTLASRNVTNPFATATTASSVMLTWTPPAGIYLCELERSLSGLPFQSLSRLPGGAYRYVDEMPDLMSKAPRYRIACGGGGRPLLPAVAFPNPTPAG
jgi:hypothetical protein